jgi:CheY-like chemotaxis protein
VGAWKVPPIVYHIKTQRQMLNTTPERLKEAVISAGRFPDSVRMFSKDHIVHTALDGEQALRAVLRNLPDLVVTDPLMPGIDGVELVQTLRNTPSTAAIPISGLRGSPRTRFVFRDSNSGRIHTSVILTASASWAFESAQCCSRCSCVSNWAGGKPGSGRS